MNLWGLAVLGTVGSYLVGGIPFGLMAGWLKGVDIRRVGSGNVGATNVGRLLGLPWGVGVFLLDLLKGFGPTLLSGRVFAGAAAAEGFSDEARSICWLLVGLGAILGHNYSPFFGFRGGRGVSTSLGVALGVYPDLTIPALAAVGVWVLGVALSRMSSVGSLAAAVTFPLTYLAVQLVSTRPPGFRGYWPFVIFTFLVAAMVIARHHANLRRILDGTEPRLGHSAVPPARSSGFKP